MPRIYPLFGVILLTCGVVLGFATWRSGADLLRPGGPERLLRFAGPLLRLENPSASGAPASGVVMPMGGVPILVRFQGEGRVLPDTFRCLLNGTDVTHLLTVGVNGVAGTVYPLREGQNQLRVEVFGKTFWSGQYLQDSFELPIQARPLSLDQA